MHKPLTKQNRFDASRQDDRHAGAWRLLLSGAMAAREMGRGRPPHGGAWPCLGAHRRIRLVAYRAAIRHLPVGMDGRGDRGARLRRPQGHPRYADRRTAEVAGRPLPGYPARRRARRGSKIRRAPALLFLQPALPHRSRPHHRSHGPPLRRKSLRARLADGQRIRRPRHDPQLFGRGKRLPSANGSPPATARSRR